MGGLIAYIVIALIVGSIAAGVLVWSDFLYSTDGFFVFLCAVIGAVIGAFWIWFVPLAVLVGLVWLGHKAVVTWLDNNYGEDR